MCLSLCILRTTPLSLLLPEPTASLSPAPPTHHQPSVTQGLPAAALSLQRSPTIAPGATWRTFLISYPPRLSEAGAPLATHCLLCGTQVSAPRPSPVSPAVSFAGCYSVALKVGSPRIYPQFSSPFLPISSGNLIFLSNLIFFHAPEAHSFLAQALTTFLLCSYLQTTVFVLPL